MMGMVWKDALVMRKNITYYLVFLVIYGVLSVMGVFPYSVLAGMVALLGMMTPMSSFAYDDQARWERFAVCTPAGRRGVVKGKFLFALLGTLLSAVVVSVILTVMVVLGVLEAEVWWEPLAVVGICVCVTLMLNSIFMPFLLKYGAEKARILSLLIFGAVFGGMALLAYLVEHDAPLPAVPGQVAALAPILLPAAAAIALAVSYAVSLRIYQRKEL